VAINRQVKGCRIYRSILLTKHNLIGIVHWIGYNKSLWQFERLGRGGCSRYKQEGPKDRETILEKWKNTWKKWIKNLR